MRCPRAFSIPYLGRRQCGDCWLWIDVPSESCDAFILLIAQVAYLKKCDQIIMVKDDF